MLSVAEAEAQVFAAAGTLPAEDCPIAQANGRVLRQALAADRDLPPFDRVALDGYAIRHERWRHGTRRFRVSGIQAAGVRPLALPAGDACIEVMTGAVLPEGADTVVGYEETAREDDQVSVTAPALEAGNAVHRRGSDHGAGSVIVQAGARLGGREIAIAASCGYAHLAVSVVPSIAVVATGDELVDVSSPVASHQIRRSNDYALRASLVDAGYPRVERFHLRDMRHEIEHLLWHILAEYDVVLLTGGVSKGKFDFLPRVLDQLSVERLFQGVAQRPGKPFWFGLSTRRMPVFALPGNPASSFICLHRCVIPALARMSGLLPAAARVVPLAAPAMPLAGATRFLPVSLSWGARGEPAAAPVPLNTSGDFAGLVKTDGFVELPPGPGELSAGEVVRFWPWV
jgi:molybdopterin molybdotransferase